MFYIFFVLCKSIIDHETEINLVNIRFTCTLSTYVKVKPFMKKKT